MSWLWLAKESALSCPERKAAEERIQQPRRAELPEVVQKEA